MRGTEDGIGVIGELLFDAIFESCAVTTENLWPSILEVSSETNNSTGTELQKLVMN
jgi:hypothetical protein